MAANPHRISLEAASVLTAAWRQSAPTEIAAGRFDRVAFDELFTSSECVGIRIYLGRKTSGQIAFVVVGTDEAGNDLIGEPGFEGPIQEECLPCPPFCAAPNALNTGP